MKENDLKNRANDLERRQTAEKETLLQNNCARLGKARTQQDYQNIKAENLHDLQVTFFRFLIFFLFQLILINIKKNRDRNCYSSPKSPSLRHKRKRSWVIDLQNNKQFYNKLVFLVFLLLTILFVFNFKHKF